MEENNKPERRSYLSFYRLLRKLFNLRAGADWQGTVESIEANVEFRSANAWTLVFAILIASVGLNINSTAVIIGAMLISPLMGPIIGIGLALGIHDFELLKKSSRNLTAAIVISLVASTVYFLISPLSEIQSELLARTRPSFFDVLIAFFGGAAGIVALSRKEKGNAIPGVAIATALMPPLCTAGFGLATYNFSFFFGAMYLFIINCVFISISTFLFVKYIKLSKKTYLNPEQQKKINRWISAVVGVVLIPSFFMVWYLQRESFYRSQANKYIDHELKEKSLIVIDRSFDYSIKGPSVEVTILGDSTAKNQLENLKEKAKDYSLLPSQIQIHQTSITSNFERKFDNKIFAAQNLTSQLQEEIQKKNSELQIFKNLTDLSQKITSETTILFPKISKVLLNGNSNLPMPHTSSADWSVLVLWKKPPTKSEQKKMSDFLSQRIEVDQKQIFQNQEL